MPSDIAAPIDKATASQRTWRKGAATAAVDGTGEGAGGTWLMAKIVPRKARTQRPGFPAAQGTHDVEQALA